MNKTELIGKVAEKAGVSKKDAGLVVNGVIEAISEFLENEAKKDPKSRDRLQITGFGSFFVKDRAARKGVNPQTGKPIDIPQKSAPGFKPGKELKEKVEG